MAFELDLRWQPVDEVGLEHAHVIEDAAGVHVRSMAIGEFEGFHYGMDWRAELAPDWTFRSLIIERTDGARLELSCDASRWTMTGQPEPQVAGCIDFDISATPFSNTLPIRRVKFEIGVPQRFNMAWVPLDSLEPFVDGQIYTKLDETHFRYEAADGSFTQVLTIDEHGFVVDYPTLYRRL